MRDRHFVSAMGCSAAIVAAGALLGCSDSGSDQDPADIADSPGPDSSPRRPPEHLAPMMNTLPFHNGPVPQYRGRDARPVARPGATSSFSDARPLAGPAAPAGTLVLYDTTGPWGWLGELYAMLAGNLASHFGAWTSKPVGSYLAGDSSAYAAVIYVGSTYDEPLPAAFLDDVLAGTRPVYWMYNNIWQLANRAPTFAATYGFNPWVFDNSVVGSVVYKGVTLSRYETQGGGIMSYSAVDATRSTTLATAVRPDGTTFPWAIRANNLTYVGEIPFAYMTANDRYLAFADLLFDGLAPATAERHRALVRIEDVSAVEDPTALRAIADYLASQQIPFSVAVIPVYKDPLGVYNEGVPLTRRLRAGSRLVSALQYMTTKGGRLVMHGDTHQYSNVANPYDGVSADDVEFYRTHIDAADYVIYDGPVAEDSAAWATARVNDAFATFLTAGLAPPTIWEYPHYAGSSVDSKAIRAFFGTAYHRGMYFGGTLTGGAPDATRMVGQFFPYAVTDVYGWKVLPENLGNYESEAFNNNPPRLPADLIHTAEVNRVVRDGVASFFFHPYYPLSVLQEIVNGVRAAGYTFVAADNF
jgi:uncharacterized protein YdaL